MNDIEIPIFNRVYNAVYDKYHEDYPELTILNDRPEVLARFPAVVCVEDDNTTYTRARDRTEQEAYSEIMYTVEVYVDQQTGSKTLAKEIASVVDDIFVGLRFTRMSFSPMPNADRKIIRYVARYRAVVSAPREDGTDEQGLPNLNYYLYRR